MQLLKEDRELHYENNFKLFKRKRKARPVVGSNPTVIMERGQPMVKSSALPKKRKKKGLFKRIAIGIATGGMSNVIRDRKKIGKGIAKGAKAVGKAVKKVTTVSILLPLVPLVPAMRASLKKKGLNPPKKIDELARMFYKVIVRKESAFDRTDHLAPIAAIIPPIISFVKNLIKAKKNKAKLPPEENVVATEAERVIDEVTKSESGGTSVPYTGPTEGMTEVDPKEPAEPGDLRNLDGSINFKSPWVIGGIVGIIIAIVLIARK